MAAAVHYLDARARARALQALRALHASMHAQSLDAASLHLPPTPLITTNNFSSIIDELAYPRPYVAYRRP